MDIQDLEIFSEVVKMRSFTRAAANLHVGQPAVSQRMAALEAEFGKPLFERHRHGVQLSDAGRTFQTYAERILALTEESKQVIATAPANRLRVRMAGPASINSYLLPPLMTALTNAGHDVTLRDAHSHEVMQHILDGTIDVGFVIDIPNQPGIRRHLLRQDPILCVAASTHPDSRRTLSLSDLASRALVFYRFSYEADALIQVVRGGIHSLRNTVDVAPVEVAKEMLRSGEYLSFVPRLTVERELASGELVEVAVRDLPEYTWTVWGIYRDRKQVAAAVQAVLVALG